MKVLLHTCCGPCASACEPRLREEGHDVALFFSNCNIDTREEFEKRLAEARKLAAVDGVELIADSYDHEEWLEKVARGYELEPEKGARCERCFRFSLARAAAYAATHGYDAFTTSLTVSPHKVSSVIFSVGNSVAEGIGERGTGNRERVEAVASDIGAVMVGRRVPSPPQTESVGCHIRRGGDSAPYQKDSPSDTLDSSTAVPHSPFPVPRSPVFLEEDFKKKGGFLRSTQRAAELGLYRQQYCGCEFSKAAAEKRNENLR